MKGSRFIATASAAALAVTLVTTQGLSQQPDPIRAEATLNAARILEARLSTEGVTKSARQEIARLHVESAELRLASDPVAIQSLRTAGLYLSAIQPDRSAELLSAAGDRALAMGDITTAALSYLDAASALSRDGSRIVTQRDVDRLMSWVEKAHLLAQSPLLSSADKERILRRAGLGGQFAG